MGEVTAFLSHSWSDEKEAPGVKHALVARWAKRRQETTGKEPTLWLVWRSAPSNHCAPDPFHRIPKPLLHPSRPMHAR